MSKKCISILLAIVLSLSMISLVFAEETTLADPTQPDAQSETVSTSPEDATQASDTDGASEENQSTEPSSEPSTEPSSEPSTEPSSEPSTDPSSEPSTEPSSEPSTEPSSEPSTEPSSEPSTEPSTEPSSEPSTEPSSEPSTEPSSEPSTEPGTEPHEHKYTTVIKQATRTTDGTLTRVCGVCGEEITAPIAHIVSITLSNKNCIYSGNVKHPKVIATDADGNTLKKNVDFEVVYNGACQKVGKYSATITFIGKYKGTATRYFNIIPKASAIRTTKEYTTKLVVTVKNSTQASGYQIKIAEKKTFSDGVNKYIKDPSVLKKTISGLDSGTTYYVKVRAYSKITVNGKSQKLYSAWSDAVECTTK